MRKVYQAGHVSACQLYRALHPVFEENKWKSFVRRLGLLSQRDFLLRMVVEGMSTPVFALGDEGARSHALRARTDFCGPQAGQLLSQKQVLGRQRRPRTCGEGNQSDQVDGNQRQRPQAVHNGEEAHGTRHGSPRIARYQARLWHTIASTPR